MTCATCKFRGQPTEIIGYAYCANPDLKVIGETITEATFSCNQYQSNGANDEIDG